MGARSETEITMLVATSNITVVMDGGAIALEGFVCLLVEARPDGEGVHIVLR